MVSTLWGTDHGAGRENRTPTKSLENSYSTIKLVPQLFYLRTRFILAKLFDFC